MKKYDHEACGEIETLHPGYLGAQDTFYVGNLKSVERIYQQTFIDTYSKVAFAKLYIAKTPITAADMLNDRVLAFLMMKIYRCYEYLPIVEQSIVDELNSMTASCIWPSNIAHTKTKAQSAQTNGICERFRKTVLQEFY